MISAIDAGTAKILLRWLECAQDDLDAARVHLIRADFEHGDCRARLASASRVLREASSVLADMAKKDGGR